MTTLCIGGTHDGINVSGEFEHRRPGDAFNLVVREPTPLVISDPKPPAAQNYTTESYIIERITIRDPNTWGGGVSFQFARHTSLTLLQTIRRLLDGYNPPR